MPKRLSSKTEGENAKRGLRSDEIPDKQASPSAQKSPTKTRVLLAHFVGFIRQAAANLIGESEDFEVCAETNDAARARKLFERHRPHVAIVGPTLQGGDGIQLIKDIRKMDHSSVVLMLSAHEDAVSVQRAFHAGALGYLRIFDGDVELMTALASICAGKHYVSEGLRELVLKDFANSSRSNGRRIATLTDRESEVFSLIGQGASLRETAAELGVSTKTVETYEERIKQRLKLHSNVELREKATRCTTKSGRIRGATVRVNRVSKPSQ